MQMGRRNGTSLYKQRPLTNKGWVEVPGGKSSCMRISFSRRI